MQYKLFLYRYFFTLQGKCYIIQQIDGAFQEECASINAIFAL